MATWYGHPTQYPSATTVNIGTWEPVSTTSNANITITATGTTTILGGYGGATTGTGGGVTITPGTGIKWSYQDPLVPIDKRLVQGWLFGHEMLPQKDLVDEYAIWRE